MLKRIIAKLTDVDEKYRGLYTEKDGQFVLDTVEIEGMVPGDKFNEFRDNNKKLNNELRELKAALQKFDDIDLDEIRTLREQHAKLKKNSDANPEVAELQAQLDALNRNLEATTTRFQAELDKSQADGAAKQRALDQSVVDNAVVSAASNAGIQPSAMEDVKLRARGLFRNVDGKAVMHEGEQPRYSEKRPSEYLTADEWLADIMPKQAPHWYKPSGGSGAMNNGGPSGGTRKIGIDPMEFGQNLEAIAKGDVEVVLDQ